MILFNLLYDVTFPFGVLTLCRKTAHTSMHRNTYKGSLWTRPMLSLIYLLIFSTIPFSSGFTYCANSETTQASCPCAPGWIGASCTNCFKVQLQEPPAASYLSDGPTTYDNNAMCSWQLIAKNQSRPHRFISFTIKDFFTECSYDHLYIYEGDSIYSPRIATFTGSTSRQAITIQSSKVLVRFSSDLSSTRKGYNLTYTWSDCPNNCSGNGVCNNDGSCICSEGWGGRDCFTRWCVDNCNVFTNQGVCDITKQLCICNAGFTGSDCSLHARQPHWVPIRPASHDTVYLTDPSARSSHAITVAGDTVWCFGGQDSGFVYSNGLLKLNPSSGTWEIVNIAGQIPSPRFGHSLIATSNTTLLMYGGTTHTTLSSKELWLLETTTLTWRQLQSSPYGLTHHSAHYREVKGTEGEMVVLLGYSVTQNHPRTSLFYNIANDSWTEVDPIGGIPLTGGLHVGVYIPNIDSVFVHGGITLKSMFGPHPTNATALYHCSTATWHMLPSSPSAAYLHSAERLGNLIYVYGGNGYDPTDESYSGALKCFTDTFWAYNIVTRQWSTLNVPSKNGPGRRVGHQMFLQNNTVHIHGGYDSLILADITAFNPGNCKQQTDKNLCETSGCYWCNISCNDPSTFTLCDQPTLDYVKVANSHTSCDDIYDCYQCNRQADCYWDTTITRVSMKTYCLPVSARTIPPTPPECESNCESMTNCTSCLKAVENHCVWCNSLRTCVRLSVLTEAYPYGSCSQFSYGNLNTCPIDSCNAARNFSTCYSIEGCGWCQHPSETGLGTCLPGDDAGPITGNCTAGGTWYIDRSPACQCNGHSKCSSNGTCESCTNITSGENCEHCASGYYGDATNGGTCRLCPATLNGQSCLQCNEYSGVCVKCDHHASGDRCDQCEPGYYGNPINGTCQAAHHALLPQLIQSECQCNKQTTECDNSTGVCTGCPLGIIGDHCEKCSEEYIGDPTTPRGRCYFPLTANIRYQVPMEVHSQRFFSITPIRDDSDLNVTISITTPIDRSRGRVRINATLIVFSNTTSTTQLPLADAHIGDLTILLDKRSWRLTLLTIQVAVYTEGVFTNKNINFILLFSQHIPQPNLLRFFLTFFGCLCFMFTMFVLVWHVRTHYRRRLSIESRKEILQTLTTRPFASVLVILPPSRDKTKHYLSLEHTKEPGTSVATVVILLPSNPKASHHNYALGSTLISTTSDSEVVLARKSSRKLK